MCVQQGWWRQPCASRQSRHFKTRPAGYTPGSYPVVASFQQPGARGGDEQGVKQGHRDAVKRLEGGGRRGSIQPCGRRVSHSVCVEGGACGQRGEVSLVSR